MIFRGRLVRVLVIAGDFAASKTKPKSSAVVHVDPSVGQPRLFFLVWFDYFFPYNIPQFMDPERGFNLVSGQSLAVAVDGYSSESIKVVSVGGIGNLNLVAAFVGLRLDDLI